MRKAMMDKMKSAWEGGAADKKEDAKGMKKMGDAKGMNGLARSPLALKKMADKKMGKKK